MATDHVVTAVTGAGEGLAVGARVGLSVGLAVGGNDSSLIILS